MRLEKSDEDMELPQGTEEVLSLKNERAHMLSVVPDTVAQPVTVGEEKGLPGDSSNEQLISADEMCEIEENQNSRRENSKNQAE
ncbi:hypothetical protein TNCV_2188411 [Trichonephila clavipes]|nr:hypothetical protein TNCV_2188411 [Trichonephila clavipes]